MPTYKISKDDIARAKSITKKFDDQKTHNKLDTQNNYLGYLGEYFFRRYLIENDIICTWNEFVKPEYDKADFEVGEKTLDVKTTFSESLWIQKPEWNYYVLAIVNKEVTEISFVGWLDRKELSNLCSKKWYKVEREGRVDCAIPCDKLKIMRDLIKELKECEK